MKTLLLVLLLSGCATDRYLTKEEDELMRQVCEPAHDCMVLTGPAWRAVQEFIAAHRGEAI